MFIPRIIGKFIKVEAKCGHVTRIYDYINFFNKEGKKERRGILFKTLNPTYCHNCFEKKAVIRCAWCGGSIIPGDPITLYSPNKDFKIPEYAVPYKNNSLVGCLRWGCADTGADRAGFWVMPGKVQRVLSPLNEENLVSKEGCIIIQNTGDMKQATFIDD